MRRSKPLAELCSARSLCPQFAKASASIAAILLPIFALAAPGDTTLVAKSPASTTATEKHVQSSLSTDGRFVVYRSTAPNLVANDSNKLEDIFLFDRGAGTTTRITDLFACSQFAYGWVSDAAISNTGRYVIWSADDYCASDEDATASMFMLDRQTNSRRLLGSGFGKEFSNARFSNDSSTIVFEVIDWWDDGLYQIWSYDVATENLIKVSRHIESYPTGDSKYPSVSADGSLIAFESTSADLTQNDTNGSSDIFLYRRSNDTLERVSRSTAGTQANGSSKEAMISADGRFVVYTSDATNLIAADTNNVSDIFIFEVATGKTSRASFAGTGTQLNGASSQPSVSSTGRYVSFSSLATNAVSGDLNGTSDIFVRDRSGAVLTRVSITGMNSEGNGESVASFISANGNIVLFTTQASNLTPGDTNRAPDLIVRDRGASTTALVTKAAIPSTGVNSTNAAISSDGSQIAFESVSSVLVNVDKNNQSDIFVRDYANSEVSRMSKPEDNGAANGGSYEPAVNSDARIVAFTSYANNLVPNDTNDFPDIFVRNRAALTTQRVNLSEQGEQANDYSSTPTVSDNGNTVFFFSQATNLVPGYVPAYSNQSNIYARDLLTSRLEMVNVAADGHVIDAYPWAGIATNLDGRLVAFVTTESLVPGDTNDSVDAYLLDRQAHSFERISLPLTDDYVGNIYGLSMSADARFIAFSYEGDNLASGDTNNQPDVFLRDRLLGTTKLVSVLPATNPAIFRYIPNVAVSDDGRFVTFEIYSYNSTPFESGRNTEVFIRDLQQSTATRVSQTATGTPANSPADDSSMSADGRFVVYSSTATNLVPEPLSDQTVFLYERAPITLNPEFSFAPASLVFGSVKVGKTSAAKVVTVTNTGTTSLKIKSAILSGANKAMFVRTNACTSQLAPGGQCTISVKFKPTAKGAKTAILTVKPTVGMSKTVSLSGTGT